MRTSIFMLVPAFLATALAAPTANPKVINPYLNEINAADRKAVLGDVAKRAEDVSEIVRIKVAKDKRSEAASEIVRLVVLAEDSGEKTKRREDASEIVRVVVLADEE